MNKLWVLSLILLCACKSTKNSTVFSAEDYEQKFNYSEVVGIMDDPANFPEPDRWAMYRHGQKGLNQDIYEQLKDFDNENEGRVTLRYVVEETGFIGKILVQNSSHSNLEKHAIQALRNTNRWIPALKNGQTVRALYETSVFFRTP